MAYRSVTKVYLMSIFHTSIYNGLNDLFSVTEYQLVSGIIDNYAMTKKLENQWCGFLLMILVCLV